MQYTIQKGDTLSKIAKANSTTIAALAAQNGIKDPNKIYAGNTLTIGQSTLSSTPAAQASGQQSALDAFEQGLRGLTQPVYTPVDTGAQYAAAANSYRQALESAYQRQKAGLEAQAQALSAQYEQNRKQTYANARLGAIGNNESLSALGLAGNLYAGPNSGVSESSRIRQDVALRSNLSESDRQEQAAKDVIAQKIVEAGYTRDTELARWLSDLYVAQAAAEQRAAKDTYDAANNAYTTQANQLYQIFKNAIAQGEYDLKVEKQNETLAAARAKASGKSFSPSNKSSDDAGIIPVPSPTEILKSILGGGGTRVNMTK